MPCPGPPNACSSGLLVAACAAPLATPAADGVPVGTGGGSGGIACTPAADNAL